MHSHSSSLPITLSPFVCRNNEAWLPKLGWKIHWGYPYIICGSVAMEEATCNTDRTTKQPHGEVHELRS